MSVKSSGGDYSSLSSAEAGEQGDLVSLDRQLDIECYAFDDTARVTWDGWTTDATRYIRAYAAAGEGHAGVWSTSKYRLRSSTGFGAVTTINEDYVRLEGLQFYQTSGTYTSLIRVGSISGTSDVRIERCVLNGTGATLSLAGIYLDAGTAAIRNCVAYGLSSDAVEGFSSGSGTVTIDNCTLIGGTYGVAATTGGTWTVRNVYAHGGTDAYTGTMTRTTCAHSSGSSFAGSTASVAHSTANFTNVTGGSEDYHLVSGSALIDAGTDLSGTFTTDINGTTRSAPWDIGADEFAGGGATGQPTWRRFGGVAYGRAPVGVHGVGVY